MMKIQFCHALENKLAVGKAGLGLCFILSEFLAALHFAETNYMLKPQN